MNVCAVVVWYNPNKNMWKNISNYLPSLDKCIVVDNSDKDNSKLIESRSKKIIYLPNKENLGIAKALNQGCEIAEKILKLLGGDYLLFVLGRGKSKLNNIKFIGKVNNDQMPEIYNCADLCLFPSRYEGNSLSILESASCGIPLVLSDAGLMKTEKGMAEFVCHTPSEYAERIKLIDLKSSSKKWRTFSKNFLIEKQLNILQQLIKNEK